ncbi:hypothetical protein C8N46_112125 [Kordia periserrulae]|uniref:Metal binding Ada-like protein n=1 Tax=Kordia periserrulae TaxID=701523 RepID=A0A2T6BS71_9FLAO|nr:hypothetical protein [Kordia periserrulae]PTX58817.1 hypothetical protein C8N46_112125 [Kordia periserrulae]
MKNIYVFLWVLFLSCSIGISQTVYISKKGKKDYHKKECKSLPKTSKEIKFYKAVSLGYKPCELCKPTPENTGSNASIDHSISPKTKNKKEKKTKHKRQSSSNKNYSVQCSGKTRSGRRCKRKTKNSSGRCYQH